MVISDTMAVPAQGLLCQALDRDGMERTDTEVIISASSVVSCESIGRNAPVQRGACDVVINGEACLLLKVIRSISLPVRAAPEIVPIELAICHLLPP
jgi:hypothetical protein